MNRMQELSNRLEGERLKLQMGLSPEVEIDAITLRAMWHGLCRERGQNAAAPAAPEAFNGARIA